MFRPFCKFFWISKWFMIGLLHQESLWSSLSFMWKCPIIITYISQFKCWIPFVLVKLFVTDLGNLHVLIWSFPNAISFGRILLLKLKRVCLPMSSQLIFLKPSPINPKGNSQVHYSGILVIIQRNFWAIPLWRLSSHPVDFSGTRHYS